MFLSKNYSFEYFLIFPSTIQKDLSNMIILFNKITEQPIQSRLKEKKMATPSVIWWRHTFLFNKEMSENSKNWGGNIERETLHIFWTTWGTSMKFSQKTRLHPFSRIYKFGTSYNYCKNLNWKKPSQDFQFFDFGYRTKFLSQFIFVVSEY